MLNLHPTSQKRPRVGFVLPREYLMCLRIVAGWTMKDAAMVCEVTERRWQSWELGEHSVPGAAWRWALSRAGLPQTWRPSSDLCRYASTLVGTRCDVVAVHRELSRKAPAAREEPIVAWRKRQQGEGVPEACGPVKPPVEKVVLRRPGR